MQTHVIRLVTVDQPDNLNRVTGALARHGADVELLTSSGHTVTILARHVDKAVAALEDENLEAATQEVIALDAPRSMAALHALVQRIASGGVVVHQCILDGRRLYMRCSDNDAAVRAVHALVTA